jgi:apolipoprotein N-acyltransferase
MKSFLINAAAILLSALLFAASFPNPIFNYGIPFLAWVAYVPVFWVINRGSLATSVLWGALYGYTAYLLFIPWLGAFHPMARLFVSVLQLVYMAVLFPLLKLSLIMYPKKGYILQWLLWLSYEYLKTTGFLGFPYGITGYTQWQFPALIGIASIFGVWGVSALVLFPSIYVGSMASQDQAITFFRRERLAAAAWLGIFAGTLVFGFLQPDYTKKTTAQSGGDLAGTVKIALIQQNADPWKDDSAGLRVLSTLKNLSIKALEEEPETDLVVWPETAVTQRIFWHLNYRNDAQSYAVVKDLLDFLADQKTPFLIGNDDARLEVTQSGKWDRVDYNAALLMEGEEITQVYRKNHLVPFAEYFPYEKTFPRIYKTLVNADTHFWKPGRDKVVFRKGDLRFSAPICFEDCFGYISRDFTRNGAQFIVNLTNDAWAGSLSSQMQHLSMGVFRAVENRRSLVRAATSGQTCAIAPSGKILAMAPPFTETVLHAEIPLTTSRTPYTIWGDLWAILFCFSALLLLLSGVIRSILMVIKTGRKQ